jgi:hypothetical protein
MAMPYNKATKLAGLSRAILAKEWQVCHSQRKNYVK